MERLQAVYDDPTRPETWVQPLEEDTDGTWTAPATLKTDELTPLTPFRKRRQNTKDDGTPDPADIEAFFTSKDVRSLQVCRICHLPNKPALLLTFSGRHSSSQAWSCPSNLLTVMFAG
jgi:hypothetical protein